MFPLDLERQRVLAAGAEEFHSQTANQMILHAVTDDVYRTVVAGLHEAGYFLVTHFVNDERELIDNCYQLYTLFSHPSLDLLVTVMKSLERGGTSYPSIRSWYPAAIPFEHEVAAGFGLKPLDDTPATECFRHATDPLDCYPLRRTTQTAALREAYDRFRAVPLPRPAAMPAGNLEFPIGPIHAGVIGAGHFRFHVGGEAIEAVDINLGFTHKGIERLFQTHFTLRDGWKLAQHVVGDSTVAHTLAYCHALEAMAGTMVPRPALWLRVLALELERLHNHLNDCAALAHDVALDLPASQMSAAREALLRLNARLSGHRLLRNLICPGGVQLPTPFNADDIRTTLRAALKEFLSPARYLLTHTGFRARLIGVGLLTPELAGRIGALGLAARASSLQRDFRQLHPCSPMDQSEFQAVLADATFDEDVYARNERVAGDVFARYAMRVAEVSISARLIEFVLDQWDKHWTEVEYCSKVNLQHTLNFRSALGYAEGWRGPVVYWLMKDKFERIYRCKVCDPSTVNWPALKAAVEPYTVAHDQPTRYETLLADFPIVNKSFNLSYAGNDL